MELLQQLLPATGRGSVTLVGESFGGCLALRVARAAPALVSELVLVNPATSFNQSLNGLSSFISATNLLGLFPQVGRLRGCAAARQLGSAADGLLDCSLAAAGMMLGCWGAAGLMPLL